MWRIGFALYVKAGGVPWKLAEADPETAYIGLSYAVRPMESKRPRFVTCCSQVFDAEGPVWSLSPTMHMRLRCSARIRSCLGRRCLGS